MTYHWHSNQHHDDAGNSTATRNIRNYSREDATLPHTQTYMYTVSQQKDATTILLVTLQNVDCISRIKPKSYMHHYSNL